jgi:hypothetical protein
MKFIFALVSVAFAAAIQPVPISDEEVAQFNELVQQVLPDINGRISTTIKESKLDPLTVVRNGALTSNFNAGVCKGVASLEYGIYDLTGLSNLAIQSLTIMGAELDGERTFLSLVGVMKPLDVSALLRADAGVKCGIVKPKVNAQGRVYADQFQASVNARVVLDTTNQLEISQATLNSINVDVMDVDVELRLGFLNPILNKVIDKVQFHFKSLVLQALNQRVREELQKVVNARLPFPITL